MDPVTVIGLLASVAQLVEVGANTYKGVKELQRSASGLTPTNERLAEKAADMKKFASKVAESEAKTNDENELKLHASRCYELSCQIIASIEATKLRKSKSTGKAILAAFKSRASERERDVLQQQLRECQQQLQIQMTFVSRSEFRTRLSTLAEKNDAQLRILDNLQHNIHSLQECTTVHSIGDQAAQQLKDILSLPRAVRETMALHSIRKVLRYDRMRDRYDVVQPAHYSTFRWVLEEDSAETKQSAKARNLFTNWLAQGDEYFHIVGKPGSGKSTLMKFLYSHQRTRTELEHWANGKNLVLASFYFWRPGSDLQKSLRGLQRSLLHDILEDRPHLAERAFPSEWQSNMAKLESRLPLYEEMDLSDEPLRLAFERLFNDKEIRRNYRFCFFLDGLDEFDDPSGRTVRDMIERFQSWIVTAGGSLKICVSSREENVFYNAFASERRIRLQDLTESDMLRYARDKVRHVASPVDDCLVEKVVQHSDGIFLWVTLVVNRLIEFVDDGKSLQSFEEELSHIPTKLEELFTYLLGSISKSDLERAHSIFVILKNLGDSYFDLPLELCLWLEHYLKDQRFAMNSHCPKLLDPLDTRLNKARRYLQGICKGLVEVRVVSAFASSLFVNEQYAAFSHRSIPEFLERSIFWQDNTSQFKQFNSTDAMSQWLLAELRGSTDMERSCLYWQTSFTKQLFRHRFKEGLDLPPFDYLTVLESTFAGCWPRRELPVLEDDFMLDWVELYNPHFVSINNPWDEVVQLPVTSLAFCCAERGTIDYVRWTIEHDLEFLRMPYHRTLLLFFLVERIFEPEVHLDNTFDIFRKLLQDGIPRFCDNLVPTLLQGHALNRMPSNEGRRLLEQLVELFLRRGSSTRMILFHFSDLKSFGTRIYWRITAAHPAWRKRLRRHISGGNIVIGFLRKTLDRVGDDVVVPNDQETSRGAVIKQMPLKQLVDIWDFHNKKEIAELIDSLDHAEKNGAEVEVLDRAHSEESEEQLLPAAMEAPIKASRNVKLQQAYGVLLVSILVLIVAVTIRQVAFDNSFSI